MADSNGGSKTLLWVVLAVILVLVILFATGIIDLSSEGGEMPEVEVQEGSLPDIDADVADVDVVDVLSPLVPLYVIIYYAIS